MNARLVLAALLLLAAPAFPSAAERDGGSILIGAGAVVADSECGLNSYWDCVQQEHEKFMAAECESLWGKGTVCGVPTGAGAKVAGPICLFGPDCNLNSDSTDVWNGSEPDTIVCGSDWDCDLQRLKLRLGVAALAAGFTADWTDAEVARAMAAAVKTREGAGKPVAPKTEAEPAKVQRDLRQ